MIDIHSHVLPHIDDGDSYINKSVWSVKRAANEGITHMIVSPHHGYKKYFNTRGKILDATLRLRLKVAKEKIPVQILPGQEPVIFENMIEGLNSGALCTLADRGQYLFVDLPRHEIPEFASRELTALQQHGIIPILTHPERNEAIRKNPDWLFDMVRHGIATQITAGSLIGDFGRLPKKFSYELIEHGLTHFIASDHHGIHKHKYRLNKAYNVIQQRYGTERVGFYQENADLLIHSQHIISEEPEPIRRKKRFLIG